MKHLFASVLVSAVVVGACSLDRGGLSGSEAQGGATATSVQSAGGGPAGPGGGGPGGAGPGGAGPGGAGGASTTTGTGGGGGMPTPCTVFPPGNWWNTDISSAPVDSLSGNYIASIGANTPLHPDFGTSTGIPYVNVDSTVPKIGVSFEYSTESDMGPYPIPTSPPMNGDGYVLMVHEQECKLYELLGWQVNGSFDATAGAIWDLTINATRTPGWTSADSAGLPIYPGLVRHEEAVVAGEINHALRFSANQTQKAFAAPASHHVGNDMNTDRPPMGLRLRLRPEITIPGPPEVQVIVTALKKYGMFLASTGGDLYLSGAPNPSWNDANIQALDQLRADDFEAIETGTLTTIN